MAGGEFYIQDLEDLCTTLGRPTFTFFKPSEMFTKNTLLKVRARLREKIEKFDGNSLFKWAHSLQVFKRKGKISISEFKDEHLKMPHPTPFIRSQLSKGSTQSIKRHLKSMIHKVLAGNPLLDREIPLSLYIYLKPDRIAKGLEKRVIAQEDVYLPHRYVILRPVRLEIVSSDKPAMVLIEKDIHSN